MTPFEIKKDETELTVAAAADDPDWAYWKRLL